VLYWRVLGDCVSEAEPAVMEKVVRTKVETSIQIRQKWRERVSL
jgi:hypothetical protein